MGRAENIKRAKRLKEAKRLREQNAKIAEGLGPGGIAIQEKASKAGIKTQLNTGAVKYSVLLKQLVHPTVDAADNISVIKSKYFVGAMAWNAASLRGDDEALFQETRKKILTQFIDDTALLDYFDELVRRKEESFSEFTNLIVDMEIKPLRGLNYDLTVLTSQPKTK